eukprot:gene15476-20966_t
MRGDEDREVEGRRQAGRQIKEGTNRQRRTRLRTDLSENVVECGGEAFRQLTLIDQSLSRR